VALPLFRSTKFGDDQDRPIKKSDGSWTYFGADLAYHFQKAQTADALVDIWGADHAGTVKRIKAAVAAMTGAKGSPRLSRSSWSRWSRCCAMASR
jgi:arginyl-tRNA synthetase